MFFPGARGIMVSNLPGWAAPPRGQERPMIPTYEQMGDWLEEIAGEFPDAFFEELDGGQAREIYGDT